MRVSAMAPIACGVAVPMLGRGYADDAVTQSNVAYTMYSMRSVLWGSLGRNGRRISTEYYLVGQNHKTGATE